MKTIKVTRPHWGGLIIVLTAAMIVGTALAIMCEAGVPMLAAKLGGDVFMADRIVRILAFVGNIPWWVTAALAFVSLGAGAVWATISRYGAKFAVQW